MPPHPPSYSNQCTLIDTQTVCFVLLMFTGYDKMKAFGFPIHGAIDGYSRKILWLKVTRSNNLPSVPAQYYLDRIKENDRCPVLLRTDCGTENGIMAAGQCFSVRKVGILTQLTELIDMGLHPKIKELKIGGPFSEEEALHGGLTFSTKCVTLNYLI